jgi:hypothetical protein
MHSAPSGELTLTEIKALAASIYEPQPRLLFEGRWECPQCHQKNMSAVRHCACGITRDGLPEFCQRLDHGEDPAEAAHLFKALAEGDASRASDSFTTLGYYRGMRGSLGEADFRWREFEFPTAPEATNDLRRQRILQYYQYRELFDREIAIARKQKRAAMALGHDWSEMAGYFRESLQVAKYRCMLRLAGLLYISRIPGALDLCDAAAFEMFRLAYRRDAT